MGEIARLGAAIKTISEKYLGNVIRAGDTEGILKWSTRLADYSTRLAALVAPALTAEEAEAVEPSPDAIGPDPIPNNALPSDTTYGAEVTLKDFTAKYGRSPEQVYSEVVTALLRPNLDRWAAFPAEEAAAYRRDDLTRQQAVLDYFAGKAPFSSIAGYFGGWYADLGLVDIAAIHDLGAKV